MPDTRQRGDRLTAQQWDCHKKAILTLYNDQGYTMKETARYMSDHYDINPTLRMYKSRVKDWNAGRKNLTNRDYNAMWTLLGHLNSQYGCSVTLTADTGAGVKTLTRQNIKKQLDRPSKGKSKGWDEIELTEALDSLTNLRVRAFQGAREININSLVRSDLDATPRPALSGPPLSNSPPTSPASDSSLSTQRTEPRSFWPRDAPPSFAATLIPRSLSADMSFMSQDLCTRCPQSSTHLDYDHNAELEIMLTNPASQLAMFPHQSGTDKTQKHLVSLWSVPYVMDCLADEKSARPLYPIPSLTDRLLAVLNATDNNMFLLPCLNWVACVLAWNCRRDQLREFVDESVKLITAAKGTACILRLPFAFMSAYLHRDNVELQRIGDQLEPSYAQVRAMLPDGHPSTIVYFYFMCFYALWYQKDHVRVRDELKKTLPALKKLLGGHNTLTLNCMVMLGRCYVEMGQHFEARQIFMDALHQMGQPSKEMRAYRLHILDLQSHTEIEAGDLEIAERHLQEVLSGRLELFQLASGVDDADEIVWETIYEVEELLIRLGRKQEALSRTHDFVIEYVRARGAWYRKRGYEQAPAEGMSEDIHTRTGCTNPECLRLARASVSLDAQLCSP